MSVMLDELVDSKIREIQAEQISELGKNVSYSKIIDQLLKQSLSSLTR